MGVRRTIEESFVIYAQAQINQALREIESNDRRVIMRHRIDAYNFLMDEERSHLWFDMAGLSRKKVREYAALLAIRNHLFDQMMLPF